MLSDLRAAFWRRLYINTTIIASRVFPEATSGHWCWRLADFFGDRQLEARWGKRCPSCHCYEQVGHAIGCPRHENV